MKKQLLLALLCVAAITIYAQAQEPQPNKSLGVGTTTPNPNAALHVESPTGNQGFIMPRLTTAQRTAITGLGAGDIGLLVFDTDLKDVAIWDGVQWDIGGEQGGNPRTLTSSDTSATLHVINNGTIGSVSANASAILAETTTAFSAITGLIPASASQANAVSGITKSTDPGSWAGYFDAQNGTAVFGITRSNLGGPLSPVGIYGESTGTGSNAAAFRISNAGNTFPAIYAETNGTAPVLFLNTINAASTAPGIHIQSSATNPTAIFTNGKISAGSYFANSSTSNPAIHVTTSTSYTALHASSTGANRNAAIVESTGGAGNYPALQVNTDGTGSAGFFNNTNNANGSPTIFVQTNSNGSALSGDNTLGGDVISIQKSGSSGSAGNFQTTNDQNPASALYATSNSVTGGTTAGLNHSGNGVALAIFNGGVRVSAITTSSSPINTRATAYAITGGSVFSFGFTTNDGDTFYVYNESASPVTVAGVTINPGEGKTLIQFPTLGFRSF